MANQDVEDILEEIRERVRAGESTRLQLSDESVGDSPSPAEKERSPQFTSSLTRSYSGLTVMARAWDRLPPLVSNRSGTVARLELWLKAQLKRLTRWFTWEQVNFNAATHEALREIVESLSNYEQHLARFQVDATDRLALQQAELNAQRADLDAQRIELKAQQAESNTHRAELKAHLAESRSAAAQQHELIENRKSEMEAALADLRNQLAAIDTQRTALQAQLAALATELRERDENLLDEQRVCFKQLSLEASESLVLQDRARRELESRLAKLESTKG